MARGRILSATEWPTAFLYAAIVVSGALSVARLLHSLHRVVVRGDTALGPTGDVRRDLGHPLRVVPAAAGHRGAIGIALGTASLVAIADVPFLSFDLYTPGLVSGRCGGIWVSGSDRASR